MPPEDQLSLRSYRPLQTEFRGWGPGGASPTQPMFTGGLASAWQVPRWLSHSPCPKGAQTTQGRGPGKARRVRPAPPPPRPPARSPRLRDLHAPAHKLPAGAKGSGRRERGTHLGIPPHAPFNHNSRHLGGRVSRQAAEGSFREVATAPRPRDAKPPLSPGATFCYLKTCAGARRWAGQPAASIARTRVAEKKVGAWCRRQSGRTAGNREAAPAAARDAARTPETDWRTTRRWRKVSRGSRQGT